MPKGRMAYVMDQRKGLDQIDVELQLSSDGAGDLGDFEGVRQAIAKVVRVAASEYLSLGLETAKSARVDDTIAVTLKVVAVRMRRLGIAASAGSFDSHRVVGEHGGSVAEVLGPRL